ncbi:MAG: M14 family metallopeptidase [Anaerolineae bacterium]|jgi:hypothetical protein|nr:M14 family metallopeptidase [Anaerolineae bacterium]
MPTLAPTFPPPILTPNATPTVRAVSVIVGEQPTSAPLTATFTAEASTLTPPAENVITTEPVVSPTAIPRTVVFGQSVEGRDLTAYRLGDGSRSVMLVGAVHGGFEANTTELMEALAEHFRANPADLPADITLWIIPALNPDGVERGRVLDGRFNANGVDLNRNWPCGWQPVAYFRDQTVSAGAEPLSEPETRALADLITSVQPAATLFYHAAASGVFAGTCGGEAGSGALAASVGLAAGYDTGEAFSAYPVTGTAPAWVNSLGLAAADVELASSTDPEFERNLAGVQAAACWVSSVC